VKRVAGRLQLADRSVGLSAFPVRKSNFPLVTPAKPIQVDDHKGVLDTAVLLFVKAQYILRIANFLADKPE
jgi:hypothetical protein